MYRCFLIILLLPLSGFARDDRFPSVRERVQGSHEPVQYLFDAGDLHAESQNNGLVVNWVSEDGFPKNWDMKPALYQDQVICPDELVQCNNSSFPCYGKCIFSPPIIQLYDSKDKTFYFSLFLDVGQNKPHAVFLADLNSKKISILFQTDFYSGLRNFALSPSATFLAYLASWHGSACEGGRILQVFDLKKKSVVKPLVKQTSNSTPRTYVFYDSIDWLTNSKLRLKGQSLNCEPNVTDTILIEAIATLPTR